MKICIAISTIDKIAGGPSRSVPLLAKGLAKCGMDITLLTRASDSMNLEILANSDVKVKIIDKRTSYKALEKTIVNEKFDIIHSQNLWLPFYHDIAKIARKNKIPYIMTPRGTLEPWCLNDKKIFKRLKKRLALAVYQKNDLNKAACILATANMEADNIRNLGITSPIAVIPNGLDINAYTCRKLDSVDKVNKQILFLSRIVKKKGIELLIEAWSKIGYKYKDWQIIIAGNGESNYIAQLNQLILNKSLQDSIKIIPPVFGSEKIKLYQESGLFILPTYSENFGMVIAESMSCGVPVITTTGTPWMILNERKIGWCIDLSIDNLSQTLCSVLDLGIQNLFDIGQQASLFIRSSFGYEEVARKMKLVYEWVMNLQPAPDYVQRL